MGATLVTSLSKALIHPNNDTLVKVYYFSAFAGWISADAQERHRSYVAALRTSGVETIMGTFKKKPRKCPSCNHKWDGHEEKESDVNLALHLLKHAYDNAYDKAIIFTADTDLAPAIRMVRHQFPEKDIRVAIPERRLERSNALADAANGKIRITEQHFVKNLFPERIEAAENTIILRPEKYNPP